MSARRGPRAASSFDELADLYEEAYEGPARARELCDLRLNARGELEPIGQPELARQIIGRMLQRPAVPRWASGLAFWIARNTPARIHPEELVRVGAGPVARLLKIMSELPHMPRA